MKHINLVPNLQNSNCRVQEKKMVEESASKFPTQYLQQF